MFKEIDLPPFSTGTQIAIRYRNVDSPTGVTRETAKRVEAQLGVRETKALDMAMYQLAVQVLPQYQADDGPLTAAQLRQIKKSAALPSTKRSARSGLFGAEGA